MTSFFLVVADLQSTQVPEVRRVVVSSSTFCALLWSSREMNRHHAVDAAIPHFEGAGFTFRPSHNPADELLDFVMSPQHETSTRPYFIPHLVRPSRSPPLSSTGILTAVGILDRGPSFLRQTVMCHNRSILQQSRNLMLWILELSSLLIVSDCAWRVSV